MIVAESFTSEPERKVGGNGISMDNTMRKKPGRKPGWKPGGKPGRKPGRKPRLPEPSHKEEEAERGADSLQSIHGYVTFSESQVIRYFLLDITLLFNC